MAEGRSHRSIVVREGTGTVALAGGRKGRDAHRETLRARSQATSDGADVAGDNVAGDHRRADRGPLD